VFELRIKYRPIDRGYVSSEFKRAELIQITFCCEWIGNAFTHAQIRIDSVPFRIDSVPFQGKVYVPYILLMPSEQRFKYCPFCGKPIEVEEVE
jgi:hypothetical protein